MKALPSWTPFVAHTCDSHSTPVHTACTSLQAHTSGSARVTARTKHKSLVFGAVTGITAATVLSHHNPRSRTSLFGQLSEGFNTLANSFKDVTQFLREDREMIAAREASFRSGVENEPNADLSARQRLAD